jgi:hypothetical protein
MKAFDSQSQYISIIIHSPIKESINKDKITDPRSSVEVIEWIYIFHLFKQVIIKSRPYVFCLNIDL